MGKKISTKIIDWKIEDLEVLYGNNSTMKSHDRKLTFKIEINNKTNFNVIEMFVEVLIHNTKITLREEKYSYIRDGNTINSRTKYRTYEDTFFRKKLCVENLPEKSSRNSDDYWIIWNHALNKRACDEREIKIYSYYGTLSNGEIFFFLEQAQIDFEHDVFRTELTKRDLCFIASWAFYPDINARTIYTLQTFRDNALQKTSFGKYCTRWYYKNGEKIVEILEFLKIPKFFVRYILMCMAKVISLIS